MTIFESRGVSTGPLHFKKVEIRYSDGTLFYNGWIQDFGDARTGPTVFQQNYKNFDLEEERVVKRTIYWQPKNCDQSSTEIFEATKENLDEIIDLNFQNYFDGGYNRISAYQGLNHKIDESHTTLALACENSIFGFLYIDLKMNAVRGEAYFDSLFCAHCFRGKGIGNMLLSAGLDRVKQKGFEKVSGNIIGAPEHCERIAKCSTPTDSRLLIV